MAANSNERLLVTGVTRQDLEFALGFVGLSDYEVDEVTEPISLGLGTIEDLKEIAKEIGANPQLATRLVKRLQRFYPHLITENGSIDLDGLAEVNQNADRWYTQGQKTYEFGKSVIDSKRITTTQQTE